MIQLEGLGKKNIAGNWVFKNLFLKVAPQESIALLGRSGCGKSLLLKIIAGLIRPTEGRSRTQGTRLGMLFQKNALFDSMTVLQNLTFPLLEQLKMTPRQARFKAQKMLEDVGLGENSRQYPHEISGGMQKRLGIARCLIVEPEIVLYDEPTAGLDPVTGKAIIQLMRHLQKQMGSTLVTVSHEVQRLYELADRLFFLAEPEVLIDCGAPLQAQTTPPPAFQQFISGKIPPP